MCKPLWNYPPVKYNVNTIWFQTHNNLVACAMLVNNIYVVDIINKNNGKNIVKLKEKTLPLAMKKVFEFFNKLEA